MRVRTLLLRLLAAALTAGWTVTAAIILITYRPGGPIDLVVGLVAGLPILIAAAAIVWPPVARGERSFRATAWLAVGSLVVLVPSIADVFGQLQARGPQTLVPSLEAGYPWALALVGTALFAGFGIARRHLGGAARRRRRFVRGAGIGSSLALLVAVAFAGVAIANDVALRDRSVASSRFGPTDSELEPPSCLGPLDVGSAARVDLILSGDVDRRPLGTVDVRGVRSGDDVRWLAYVATSQVLGVYGAARVGDEAYVRRPETGWIRAALAAVADAGLDALVLDMALQPDVRSASEMHGISFFEGARARHCRVAIDGTTFRQAFPQVRWLVGDADLGRWRGELDFWVFVDGELGRVAGFVNGEGGHVVEGSLQATVRGTMTMTDRARPTDVSAPTR